MRKLIEALIVERGMALPKQMAEGFIRSGVVNALKSIGATKVTSKGAQVDAQIGDERVEVNLSIRFVRAGR